jgi:hypothetical protein
MTAFDSVADPNPGNIGMATVLFVNRTTRATLATVAVTADLDPRTGTATYNLPASALGTATSVTLKLGFAVSGYYNRNSTTEDVTITIKK